MRKQSALMTAIPLFLAIFIDGVGLGILFPILNAVILEPQTSILGLHSSLPYRNFIYGLVISTFMFFWFFGSTILGDISDRIGRRKALVICLMGSAIGYLISAIAVIVHSATLLVLGRIIDGFTAGSQPIAQAAIVDLSSKQHKTRNISYILFSASLGFIFGPLIGGFFSDNHLVSWFNTSTPLFVATIISSLNALLIYLFLRESHTGSGRLQIKFMRAVDLFVSAFKDQRIKHLSIILLTMMIGWSSYFTYMAVFLLHRFHYDTLHVSLYLSLLACGFGTATIYLIDMLSKRFSLTSLVINNAYIVAGLSLLTLLTHNQILTWIYVYPLGIAIAIVYTCLINLFSNQVGDDVQGWVMGVTGSIMAFAFTVVAILDGLLVNISYNIPLVITVIFITAAGCILSRTKAKL